MPEWLLNKEDYIPPKSKDAFINKSILSILGVLTKFRLHMEHKVNKFGINAATKVVATLFLILMVSLSRNIEFLIVIGAFLFFMVSLQTVAEIKYILRVSLLAAIFTFIILVPSILMGNKNNSSIIVFKVLETVTLVSITSCTTRWNDITRVLKLFFIPDIFIFVLDMTMKYIVILGEFALNMLYSLKLRSIGKNKNKSTALSGIIGTMFLKSKEMAEEVYGAMECRGFTGEYKSNRKERFRLNDAICVLVVIGFGVAYFYFDRL